MRGHVAATFSLCESFANMEKGAGVAQWRERSPPLTGCCSSPAGCHIWVEFFVGSRLSLSVFILVLRFSFLHEIHKKQHSHKLCS